MISPKICHCIHYRNMSKYVTVSTTNTWDTKYATVSNTWAIKDTVTSYFTKCTLCIVAPHPSSALELSTTYHDAQPLRPIPPLPWKRAQVAEIFLPTIGSGVKQSLSSAGETKAAVGRSCRFAGNKQQLLTTMGDHLPSSIPDPAMSCNFFLQVSCFKRSLQKL